MSSSIVPPKSSSTSDCDASFQSGSITLVLDAPRTAITSENPLPLNFRSMNSIPNISGGRASGSAQYSRTQIQNMISGGVVGQPLTVVDLRQESHGFVTLAQAVNGETEIAVSWFVERDWINVAKGPDSIEADELNRLGSLAKSSSVTVYDVKSKTPNEDGICTVTPYSVSPSGSFANEQTVLQPFQTGYLRLPTTDHCRPRDSEVDDFVAFEMSLDPNAWLHFHCRAGDGRTTTFLAMHDIIHNAPADSLPAILTRQGPSGIGGVDLGTAPKNQADFDYPFSAERVAFMQNFYTYVCAAKPKGFALAWSAWLRTTHPSQSVES